MLTAAKRRLRDLIRHACRLDGVTCRAAAAQAQAAGLERTGHSTWARIVSGDRLPRDVDEAAALIDLIDPDAFAKAAALVAGGTYLPAVDEVADLTSGALHLSAGVGRVAALVSEVMADGQLDAGEAQRVHDVLTPMMAQLQAMASSARRGAA